VVMGHTECGAVTAAVKGEDAKGKLQALIKKIDPAVQKAKKDNPELQGSYFLKAAIKANVTEAMNALVEASPVIKEMVEARKVKVIGAIYNIYTGEVEWIDVADK